MATDLTDYYNMWRAMQERRTRGTTTIGPWAQRLLSVLTNPQYAGRPVRPYDTAWKAIYKQVSAMSEEEAKAQYEEAAKYGSQGAPKQRAPSPEEGDTYTDAQGTTFTFRNGGWWTEGTGAGGRGGTSGGTSTSGGVGGEGPATAMDAILEEFQNALASFINQGWSWPVANWMRQRQDLLSQRFLEQYLAAQPSTGNLVEYTPMDFLSKFNPEVEWRMTPMTTTSPSWTVPSTATRRLRY